MNIAQTALYDIRLELASAHTEVNISGQTVMVDTSQTSGTGFTAEWPGLTQRGFSTPVLRH